MGARCLPSDWKAQPLKGAAAREFDLMERLSEGLGDGYTIFHGLHWSRLEKGLTVTGRLQFIVLTPRGAILLLAQRTGLLKQENGRLFKRLGDESTDLFAELNAQREVLLSVFSGALKRGFNQLVIEPFLICPDHTIVNPGGLAVSVERLFDANRQGALIESLKQIDQLLPSDVDQHARQQIEFRLCNYLKLVPEIGQLTQASERWVTRLTQGLEDWVYRLSFNPFRLRIQGTAGSGKSLLAVAEMRRNQSQRQRTLYLCYNRPLASELLDRVKEEGLRGVEALNFHALCDRLLLEAGIETDFSKSDAFDQLVIKACSLPVNKRWVFDSIIVDEGQDFEPEWLAVLEKLSHPETRWLWLEDLAQNLYGRQPVHLANWVSLNVPDNYRNPQRVARLVSDLLPLFEVSDPQLYQVQALCPLEGIEPQLFQYRTRDELLNQTALAITAGLKLGFARDQMVVLSLSGLSNSVVLKERHLGPHKLRHFTGKYDSRGHQEFTEGEVLAETVYRFKGRAAHCVVITEVEFAALDERAFRKLFVAITRAKMQVMVVAREGLLPPDYFKSSINTA